MRRRPRVQGRGSARRGAALAAAALLLAASGCGESGGPPERILLVMVDTLRRDHVVPYDDRVETPRVEALAERGQVFTRAVASYHQTTMTMASLFTGRTPSLERSGKDESLELNGRSWCGMMRFAEGPEDACIPEKLPTLAEKLAAEGYWTAGVVANKLLYRPGGYHRGFERWEELPSFAPSAVEANRVARRVLEERPKDRFFLYVHYMDVHDYGYRGEPYASGVPKVDWALGDLMEALEAKGLREDTLVVFTSDHGERLGEEHFTKGLPGHNGNPSFETLLEIPLIVAPPVFEDRQRPVRSDDLHRMLLRVAGAEVGPPPLLEEGELFVSEREYRTHRQGRWKLFRERATGEVQLVDLEADPGETSDVADAHPEVVEERSARIDALVEELGVSGVPELDLSEEDAARLRALGYLEPEQRRRRAR